MTSMGDMDFGGEGRGVILKETVGKTQPSVVVFNTEAQRWLFEDAISVWE